MSESRRKLLLGLLILFVAGLVVGGLNGRPVLGLLVASLVALGWQLRQLFALERALRTRDYEAVRYGSGIWGKVVARINYYRQRAKSYKKQYRALLKEVRKSTKAIPDGGIILNSDFEVLNCNPAAQSLVGFKPRKDRGQRVDNILRDPKFANYLRAEERQKSVEVMSPVLEGHWLNCRLVPFGADQYLLLIRDITDRIRLNKMRREFIANASHELRSPLTVISGYLDALDSDPDVPEAWQKPVSQMRSQADRMNKIVAELLELSRLEGSGQEVDVERIDVCGLLVAARKAYAGRSDVPDIEIECGSRAALSGSATEIESVIANLLSNAIRHTPIDGTVTLRWTTDDKGGELAICDTGEGIDADDIPRLTERFFRVARGRSRDDGGVGLGLAIVKHVLGRHDAVLSIESELGAGSTVTCRFPTSRIAGAELIALEPTSRSA